MNHLDLMHGKDYSGQRIAGWLVQEKFNGLRCLWTGTQLVSRNGERFNAPAWFTAGLPSVPLTASFTRGIEALAGFQTRWPVTRAARMKTGSECGSWCSMRPQRPVDTWNE